MGLSASVGGKDQVFRRSSLEPSDDVGDDDDVDNIDQANYNWLLWHAKLCALVKPYK